MTTSTNGDIGNGGNPNNNRTNDRNNSKSHSSNSSVFYRGMREHLRALDFASFQNCVLLWLGAKGYQHICVLPRSSARGRRKTGGADFIAASPQDPSVKVAIQVRHWETPVQRRAIDELRGFMLRQGISQGTIVTTSDFYPRAIAAASEFPGRPIRLVSLNQLAGSMAALGLGAERSGDHWSVSEDFFRALRHLHMASSLTGEPESVSSHHQEPGPRPASLDGITMGPHPRHEEPRAWKWMLLGLLILLVALWLLSWGGRS